MHDSVVQCAYFAPNYGTWYTGEPGEEQPNYVPATAGMEMQRSNSSWGSPKRVRCVASPTGTRWEEIQAK